MNSNEIIKQLRLKAGMSQEELARAAGYTDRSTIAKIESGKIELTESKITLFSRIFGVTPAYIMGIEKPSVRDDDLTEELQILRDNPETRTLLHSGKGLTKEQVDAVAALMRQMRGSE